MLTSNEVVFRVAVGVLWVVYFVVRLYFQGKVKGHTYTRVNAKQETLFFRLFALGYLVFPLYFLTPWLDFAHLPFPEWLRWLGAALTVGGMALFGWTHQVLGQNWTAVLALAQDHTLVTSGPYQWVRHPMYSAFFLIGFGLLALSANGLVSGAYLLTLGLMYGARVGAEEAMMLERFGDAYRAYAQKTGRLWPRWRR